MDTAQRPDIEEQDEVADLLASFRTVRQHGFGRLEVVVREGKLDLIHETKTKIRRKRLLDKKPITV